jgi:hypothetical protein
VVNLALSWPEAGALAAILYGAAFALSRVGRASAQRWWPFVREAGTIAALYGAWQLVGTLSVIGSDGAYARGRWLVHAEKVLRFPRESTVQGWVLPHPWLAQLSNLYYASLHFVALFAMLFWVFVRHRDQYGKARSSVIVLTAACLAVQLIPLAPPRLVPQAGVVDVAARYGQSVYAPGGAGVDQLSAMPSVHVGWALLIAVIVIRTSPSRWRWSVAIYPAMTVFVVVATGNHFWLDGVVAAVLLGLGELALSAVRPIVGRHKQVDHEEAEGVYSPV